VPNSDNNPIKITLDDLANVAAPETKVEATDGAPRERNYGSINTVGDEVFGPNQDRGSILLQGWFYLGAAGVIGAFIGWGICEPAFIDGRGGHRWGNIWMVPVIVAFLCVAFGVAESVVERSLSKALQRAALAFPLGIIFGFILQVVADVIFAVGLSVSAEAGVTSERSPAFWIVRAIAWSAFGIAGGSVYGIVGLSGRKAGYGILGGVIGAALGGVLFDPIAMGTHGGAASRAIGFALTGMATGIGIGLIESALKDRWLYVTSGPLAGKQFILYKPATVIGSQQQCDIYLFKDSTLLPRHAVIENRGSRMQITAFGPVYISGVPVQKQVLQSGSIIQIGRYGFRYQEKQR
jgi:type III secretion system (T3SS) inner membrane Yop/YscD-like protein